jgi:beta-glucosidase
MCSFNDINGVPSSGNIHLNDDILRKEWGYDGVLVSDWASIEQMIPHGVVGDLKEAANLSLNAKVDMDMMGFAYVNHLEELAKEGKINEKQIDESVRNILRMKFRLGLFDNPYTKIPVISPFYSEDALAKARKAAVESTVLLKNNGILPIDTEKTKTIAVVGPMSDAPADQLGTWVFDGEPERSITPLMAIKSQYGNRFNIVSEKGLTHSRDKGEAGIAKAVSATKNADIILFFAGEEAILSGEAHCLADISLPGAQTKMLEALKKTGKPVVSIIMSGSPNTIEKEVNLSDAVLLAFHGGTMAGPALADLIFGDEIPSGKLPVTIPKMVGQIPVYYAHKNTGRPAKGMVLLDSIAVGAGQTSLGNTSYHLDAGDKPLFPFGYGLSYSNFSYSTVKISKTKATMNEKIIVECDITNTGKYDAKEVAQLYVRDKVASLARPVRELKGFQKISLKAGETKNVKFELSSTDLGFWNTDNKYITEPGEFQVWISKDSQSGEAVSFWFE